MELGKLNVRHDNFPYQNSAKLSAKSSSRSFSTNTRKLSYPRTYSTKRTYTTRKTRYKSSTYCLPSLSTRDNKTIIIDRIERQIKIYMTELKKGDRINLTNGGFVTIVKELGRGGQGIVYLVNLNGEEKALKWYINTPDKSFYKNLQNNVIQGAPSDAFLWPEYLTERQKGSFGYVMKLRPQGYYEFGN